MKEIKAIGVMILWSGCFVLTTIFLLIEFMISLFKFKLTGKKSTRYFKPRPIFPHEEN